MCLRASFLVLVGLLAPAGTAGADTWAFPRPTNYTSPSRNRTFKVVPSDGSLSGKPKGALVLSGKDGKEKTLWQGKLVNVPHQAFVSDHSDHVVTIDTYGALGHKHSLVVYAADGKVVADYRLDDLLSAEEIRRHVDQTVSSRRWAYGKFGFSKEGKEFVARLSWGKVIHIDLAKQAPSMLRTSFLLDAPPRVAIWSGRALNELLPSLQAIRQGPEIVLPSEVLRHVNVMREGGKGSLALVRDGAKLEWPLALRHDDFQAARKRIDTLLPGTVEKVRNRQPTSAKELTAAVKQLLATMDRKSDDLPPSSYTLRGQNWHIFKLLEFMDK